MGGGDRRLMALCDRPSMQIRMTDTMSGVRSGSQSHKQNALHFEVSQVCHTQYKSVWSGRG
jgi:hypothetical protein